MKHSKVFTTNSILTEPCTVQGRETCEIPCKTYNIRPTYNIRLPAFPVIFLNGGKTCKLKQVFQAVACLSEWGFNKTAYEFVFLPLTKSSSYQSFILFSIRDSCCCWACRHACNGHFYAFFWSIVHMQALLSWKAEVKSAAPTLQLSHGIAQHTVRWRE